MAKSKEEIQKILENNYMDVQNKEFSVYDKVKEVEKTFSNAVKGLTTKLKSSEKLIIKEEKGISGEYASHLVGIIEKNETHKNDVLARKKESEVIFQSSLEEAVLKHGEATKKVKNHIAGINKENKKLIASTLASYQKEIENAKKEIVTINEKGVKDQSTFNTKIDDLRSKHEAKVEGLNDKEKTKIEKLTEASNKKVEKLQENIKQERDKLDKKLSILNPTYEEELEEIDEKISDAKGEYDTKHENIRSSADKRIAVREKHMQRAMDDNDPRSAKQHRKDIDKFKKEADRDLVLLKKAHNQEHNVTVDYRKKFIKENLDKLSKLETEYSRLREEKQHQIDDVLILLKTDIENTKFEYEKVQAEELEKYNQGFTEIKEKQVEVSRDQELDVVRQEASQVKSRYSFEKMNVIHVEKLNENLEIEAKNLRDIDIKKLQDDYLAKDILDSTNAKLDNELEIATVELAKDKKANEENEKIAVHNIEYKKYSASKDEYFSYQQLQEPLYTKRAEELLAYEELESNNRYALKVVFLENLRKETDKDHATLVKKIDNVLLKERTPFDKKIEELAGPQKEELEAYIVKEQEKINTLKLKVDALDPKIDRKDKRQLQDNCDRLVSSFNKERINKEQIIAASTKSYGVALEDAVRRNEIALAEAKVFNDAENNRISLAIDLLNTNKDNEIADAKNRFNETVTGVNNFINQATTRNQSNTEENLVYLNSCLSHKESTIGLATDLFEKSKEVLNNTLNQYIQKLASEKQAQLNDNDANLMSQEQNLETFKNAISNKIKDIEAKTELLIQAQNNKTSEENNKLEQKCTGSVKEISETLAKQVSEFKTILQTISKKVSSEKSHYDSEGKRVQKEYEQRLKEDLQKISAKLSQDISNIK